MNRWWLRTGLAVFCSSVRLFAVDQILCAKVPHVNALAISKDVVFEDLIPQKEGENTSVVEDATSHYSISNNATSNGKIIAHLNNPLGDLTIFVTLTALLNAVSKQMVPLFSSDQILVSGIGKGCFANNRIYYRVIADLDAVSMVPNFNALITYTLGQ